MAQITHTHIYTTGCTLSIYGWSLTGFKLWSRIQEHYLRILVVGVTARTAWHSGSSSVTGGANWLPRPGFESSLPQLSFEEILPLMLSVDHPSAGPWWQKWHSGGNIAPLSAIEDVFWKPKITYTESSNWHWVSRSSWSFVCQLHEQHCLTSPTSVLLKKWAKQTRNILN